MPAPVGRPGSLVLAALAAASGCASGRRAAGAPPAVDRPAAAAERMPADAVSRTRPPAGRLEEALVGPYRAGFEPTLDCVARRAAGALAVGRPVDRQRLGGTWPVDCASSRYPIAAAAFADRDDGAVDAWLAGLPGAGPFVLGAAPLPGGRVALVAARNVVTLDLVRDAGGARIDGATIVAGAEVEAYVAAAAGVRLVRGPLSAGRFAIPLGAVGDAVVELVTVQGLRREPVARVRVGQGIDGRAIALHGRVVDRPPGQCADLPPAIDGIDVNDVAWCIDLPGVRPDQLGAELAARPHVRSFVAAPDVALIERGIHEGGMSLRVIRRFEAIPPAAGAAAVVERLRQRWPSLPVRPTGGRGLLAVLERWRSVEDLQVGSTALKPEVDRIAATWTTTPRYYSGLVGGRDLDIALDQIQPYVAPRAVDAALLQVRRPDGAMWHLVALVLELP